MAFMEFHKRLEFLMQHRGIIAAELARRTGLDESRISEWLKGGGPQLRIGLQRGLLIARALDVPMEFLADEAADLVPPDVPLKWETQVREIAGRKGWEWVYWRLIEGQGSGDPIRYDDPSRKDVAEAAETLARQIRKKTS